MAQPVSDEALQLRKRARRRLVGAIALVAIVVLVLPWFLDNRPPEPLKNVEIVIPPVPPVDKQFPKAPDADAPPAAPADSATPPAAPGPAPDSASPGTSTSEPASPPPGTTPVPPPLEPEAKPAEKPQDKPTEKPAEKPVEKSAPKPADKLAEKPAPKLSAKPPEKSADKPLPKTAEKSPPKTKPPAAEKPSVAKVPPAKGHVIQLGAYSSKENANQLLADLRAAGFPGYIEPVKTPDGTKTRVRCGPFPTPEAAQAARTKLVARKLAAGELKVVQAGQ